MKGTMKDKKQIQENTKASKGAAKDYIKIKTGKNFIRFMDGEWVSEFTHGLRGNKFYREVVCLGGIKGAGYAPDVCPICAQAKKYWDLRKKLKDTPGFDKNKKLKAEAEFALKQGKIFQTKHVTKMAAVYGGPVKEKTKKGIRIVPDFEKEIKILSLSSTQWEKLTDGIFKKYPDIMKSEDDLLNRNFLFSKETADGGEVQQNTPIQIKPMEKRTDPPKVENEIPNIESSFKYLDESATKKILKEFLANIGEDGDDEDDEEAETSEEEDDDDKDEEADDEDLEELDDDDDDKEEVDDDDDDDADDDDDDDDDDKKEKSSKKKEKEKSSKKSKKSKDDEDDF